MHRFREQIRFTRIRFADAARHAAEVR